MLICLSQKIPFLDLHLTISDGFVSSKIYGKHDDCDFDIVKFPFLDGRYSSCYTIRVYISQFIWFARVCSHVADFNTRHKTLAAKLLKQGYRYNCITNSVESFQHSIDATTMVSKFNMGLKILLKQDVSEAECYGDLVYKVRKKNVGRNDFSDPFRKLINRYKRTGCMLGY